MIGKFLRIACWRCSRSYTTTTARSPERAEEQDHRVILREPWCLRHSLLIRQPICVRAATRTMTARLASLHELDGNGNAYDRHMECVESGRRREDVAPVHWRVVLPPSTVATTPLSRSNHKPLRLDIQCQRGASVKIGWKYLDDYRLKLSSPTLDDGSTQRSETDRAAIHSKLIPRAAYPRPRRHGSVGPPWEPVRSHEVTGHP